MIRSGVVLLLMSCAFAVGADDIDPRRAHYNYMLYCQGCHLPDGSGGASVPDMKGQVGHFLQLRQGREYLVRVPGAAGATLDDERLAEVLNWIILEYGGESIPEEFLPYTAEEIAGVRHDPLLEVVEYRKQLVEQLHGNEE